MVRAFFILIERSVKSSFVHRPDNPLSFPDDDPLWLVCANNGGLPNQYECLDGYFSRLLTNIGTNSSNALPLSDVPTTKGSTVSWCNK